MANIAGCYFNWSSNYHHKLHSSGYKWDVGPFGVYIELEFNGDIRTILNVSGIRV